MKRYEEFDKTEIKAIADKFGKEFVTIDELKEWYAYKQALKHELDGADVWENHPNQDSEIVQEVLGLIQERRDELSWIRSVKTFPLEDFCRYYELSWDYNISKDRPSLIMAQRVIDGASEDEKKLIREILEESDTLRSINNYRNLTTPVNLRRWGFMKRNPTEYCPFISSVDATHLYNRKTHYVYIHSECNIHRWGDSYWVSVDCDNDLYSLPVIKAFKEYEFEIGKFYKITCTDEIRWGNNKSKYVMEIEECDEETFMKEGLHQYATRW